jgi:hypothetical protein
VSARFDVLSRELASRVTKTRITLAFTEATTLETVGELLAELPENWCLEFYNRGFHSPSDPGAYVTMIRTGDRFWYQTANYGWTGPWVKRTLATAAAMVHRCRCDRDPSYPGSPMRRTLVRMPASECRPFSPRPPQRAWLTSAVLALARAVHNLRLYNRLPILADALEEAGCDNPNLLAHCRVGRWHPHGCWIASWLMSAKRTRPRSAPKTRRRG